LEEIFKKRDVRVSVDLSSETLNKKIRNAELARVPYILVCGPREAQARTVSVRSKSKGDCGVLSIEDFCRQAAEEIEQKK
jgi:threonyl-tRNA synthetase